MHAHQSNLTLLIVAGVFLAAAIAIGALRSRGRCSWCGLRLTHHPGCPVADPE